MKKLFLSIIGVAVFIAAVGVLTQAGKNKKITLNIQSNLKTIKVGSQELKVTVADSDSERAKGLSGTKSLAQNEGMLFVFPQKDTMPSFWMKDMLISIDIIWINNDKIIKIDENVPPPAAGTSDKDLKLYNPGSPIDYVLEIAGGASGKLKIKAGDIVNLSKAL